MSTDISPASTGVGKFTIRRVAAPIVGAALAVAIAGCEVGATTGSDAPTVPNSPVLQQTAAAGLVDTLIPAAAFSDFRLPHGDRSLQSQLNFLETVLSYGPPQDPRYVFLMVNFYLAANQQAYGVTFLERLLSEYGDQLDDNARASYVAAYAVLRATHAADVPLMHRIGWVLDTFDLLDEAAQLAHETNPLVHWSAGLIYAQVPWLFGKREDAMRELYWLVQHPETEPTPGFYREAYHYLAKLHADKGDADPAADYLRLAGYDSYAPSALFMGWFTTTLETGVTFSATPWMEEIVESRVFALRGFGFSDIHFVITDDGAQLVVIDAGTQPFSMEAAYNYLKARRPTLPPLTTAIITHAHWDHVGGMSFLERLNPALEIYGRGNYHGTLERSRRHHSYQQFRSASYTDDWLKGYRSTSPLDERRDIEFGGTVFELVPVAGGETEDSMLVHMPREKVLFVGDVLMPFYGEPWVEEGNVEQAIPTMDAILARNPRHVLHGHYGLTFMYPKDAIRVFRDAYAWLTDTTRRLVLAGYSAKEIWRLNLVPPGLEDHSEAFLAYLTPRNHIIARIADNLTGIWQEDSTGKEPAGLDALTAVEYGRLLDKYLALSAADVADMLGRILDGGDNELALKLATAAQARYPGSEDIVAHADIAADRLRSINQFIDPFKFVVYAELRGKEHKSIAARAPEDAGRVEDTAR